MDTPIIPKRPVRKDNAKSSSINSDLIDETPSNDSATLNPGHESEIVENDPSTGDTNISSSISPTPVIPSRPKKKSQSQEPIIPPRPSIDVNLGNNEEISLNDGNHEQQQQKTQLSVEQEHSQEIQQLHDRKDEVIGDEDDDRTAGDSGIKTPLTVEDHEENHNITFNGDQGTINEHVEESIPTSKSLIVEPEKSESMTVVPEVKKDLDIVQADSDLKDGSKSSTDDLKEAAILTKSNELTNLNEPGSDIDLNETKHTNKDVTSSFGNDKDVEHEEDVKNQKDLEGTGESVKTDVKEGVNIAQESATEDVTGSKEVVENVMPIIPQRPKPKFSSTEPSAKESESESNLKVKRPPPKPKKLSSKIAAFQQLLQPNQESDSIEEDANHVKQENKPNARGKLSSSHMKFAANLQGIMGRGIALPGMVDPSKLKSLNGESEIGEAKLGEQQDKQNDVADNQEKQEVDKEDKTEDDKPIRRAKGPKGKRLPKNLSTPIKIETSKFKVATGNLWNIEIKPVEIKELASENTPLESEDDKKISNLKESTANMNENNEIEEIVQDKHVTDGKVESKDNSDIEDDSNPTIKQIPENVTKTLADKEQSKVNEDLESELLSQDEPEQKVESETDNKKDTEIDSVTSVVNDNSSVNPTIVSPTMSEEIPVNKQSYEPGNLDIKSDEIKNELSENTQLKSALIKEE